MARPRKFDEKTVVEKIKNAFWKEGYEGTSYADLIDASGLHKGSLYAAFGDKHALYLHALQSYLDDEVAAAVAILTPECAESSAQTHPQKRDGREQIETLLNIVIDAVVLRGDRRGCLLCNAAVDQAPHDQDVAKMVSAGVQKMQDGFEAALDGHFLDGERQKKASLCNAVYFGMRVMAKSYVPAAMLEQARDGALAAIRP